MATHYFTWRSATGPLQHADHPPAPTEPVIELILNRCPDRLKQDGVRPHEGRPVHEAAMRAELPTSLQILRIDGCRLRTWPQHLPHGLVEFYASGCDFFSVPDLSAWPNLIVLEMPDNRAESLTQPLPPTLARLSMDMNALNMVDTAQPHTLANVSFQNNPRLNRILERERIAYKQQCDAVFNEAVRRGLVEGYILTELDRQAFTGYPPIPPSALAPWVIGGLMTLYQYENMMRPYRVVNGGAGGAAVAAPAVNLYTNRQNVHDTGIQSSTRHNLSYIATYKPEVPHDAHILNSIARVLNENNSLVENLMQRFAQLFTTGRLEDPVISTLREQTTTPYSMHGYMVLDIIDRLWLRIMDFPEPTRREVIQRFVEEVLEARGKCTNGFMVRMSNVLIGFDENCIMRVRPAQILQARIPATMKRLRSSDMTEGSEPWTFWRDCVVQTWDDMEDVEMPQKERGEWLTPLISPMLEDLCKAAEAIKAEGDALDEQIAAPHPEDPSDEYNALLSDVSTAPARPSLEELRAAKAAIPERIASAIAESIASAKLDLPTKEEGGRGLAFYVEQAMIETLDVTVPSRAVW